jgi:hypothetical protein
MQYFSIKLLENKMFPFFNGMYFSDGSNLLHQGSNLLHQGSNLLHRESKFIY